jgi:hypothetical protein
MKGTIPCANRRDMACRSIIDRNTNGRGLKLFYFFDEENIMANEFMEIGTPQKIEIR